MGLKITDVQTVVTNASSNTNWIFVVLWTDEGLTGCGEATLDGCEPEVVYAVNQLATHLIGRRPNARALPEGKPHGGRVYAAARSGLEQALWDLRAKRLGVPLFELLGGAQREAVPVYANVNRGTVKRTPDGFAARAEQAVSSGFRGVKCAPFDGCLWWDPPSLRQGIQEGLDRIFAVRAAVGPDVELMVDCHWRFDVPTAVRVGAALEGAGLAWLEAPVSEEDPAAVRDVKLKVPLRLSGGEMQTSIEAYRPLIEARALDILMPDVKFIGGVSGLLEAAALARAFRLMVAPHNPSGPVATAATLHAAAVMSNLLRVEFPFGQIDWYQDLAQTEFRLVDGAMAVPQGPGLGVTLDLELAGKHPYTPVQPPQEPGLYSS